MSVRPALRCVLFTRRHFFVAAALLAACSGPSGPIDGAQAMRHVEAMVAFGPRPFGSDALAKTADYITGKVKELGLEPQRQEVLHEKEKKTIRNLWVQIDGEDAAAGPILIIGAHYDTKLAEGHSDAAHNFPFVGAIDGGGGPAVLLEVARELKARPTKPKCNIWLYWIDAEESIDWVWNEERALLGSQEFCKMLSAQKILRRVRAFVLIDLIGSKDIKIDRDGNSDTHLQDLFAKAGKAMGEGARMYEYPTPLEIEQLKAQLRQRGLPERWGFTDDHITFTRFGVPSVLLIDFEGRQPTGRQRKGYEQWWHTADDNLDAMDADSLAFAGNLLMQALPDLEAYCTRK